MTRSTGCCRRLAALGLVDMTGSSMAVSEDWQVERLMVPTPAQRAAEARGAVVIYDGLEARQVANALDAHFERIQNMMFIRIHHLPPSGAGGGAVIENDGCD